MKVIQPTTMLTRILLSILTLINCIAMLAVSPTGMTYLGPTANP